MTLHFPGLGTYQVTDILQMDDFTDDYRGQALQFCQKWLQGNTEFVVPTSGSTGQPKPIQLTRAQMAASAQMTLEALGLGPGDRALVCLHPGYIAGIMMLVRGLVGDLALTVVNPSARPFAQIRGEQFAFTALVPLQLQAMLAAGEIDDNLLIFNQMKAILIGGAPVGSALAVQLQVIQAPVYATYGMTETVSHIALRRLNGPLRSEYYMALPGVILGQDPRGCLTITAPVTQGQTLITNDRVRLIDARTFEWLGRADNVINSGGVKIQVEKIENVVDKTLTYLGINRRFVVMGLPDERLGEQTTLVIEGDPLPPATRAALQAQLAIGLGRYEVPKSVRYCPIFPETATGKVDRNQLKAVVLAV